MILLKEKADYKEANSEAMVNLGLHYYNGSMGIPMNKEKATKMWSHAAGTLNNVNACMNMARHCKAVGNSNKRSVYYMEKPVILGSVDARWFLGRACYNFGDVVKGVKHFIIGAKQGDKK